MAIQYLENTGSLWGTEFSLPNNSTTLTAQTTAGLVKLFFDVAALAAGDRYQLKVYEKARTADTQRVAHEAILDGAQSQPLYATHGLILSRGWDFTLRRLAGTDRAIPWSVRRWPDGIISYLENTGSLWGTEFSLPNNSTTLTAQTTAGQVQPFIDVAAMVAGDKYEVKIYEKTRTADTQRLAAKLLLEGVQTSPLFVPVALTVSRGWDITVKRIAGADRAISWSVRRWADA